MITTDAQDAERILARFREDNQGTTFTLIASSPFSGSTEHLQWRQSWEPGQDMIFFADIPVRSWGPRYESEKLITKILLIYNADHDEETVVKTYTSADDHLAEEHVDGFSETILSPCEFVRLVDVKGMQGDIVALLNQVAALARQLAEKTIQKN